MTFTDLAIIAMYKDTPHQEKNTKVTSSIIFPSLPHYVLFSSCSNSTILNSDKGSAGSQRKHDVRGINSAAGVTCKEHSILATILSFEQERNYSCRDSF